MNVKKIKFRAAHKPKKIVVEMSVDEAGVIAKLMGQYSDHNFDEDFPNFSGSGVHSEIYGCLAGEFFNHYWDDGVDDWMRGKKPGFVGGL